MGRFLIIGLLLLLGGAGYVAYQVWTSVEGPPMPVGLYVAMWLGVGLLLMVGCGLMALLFYSSRRGYDERAHRVEVDRRD